MAIDRRKLARRARRYWAIVIVICTYFGFHSFMLTGLAVMAPNLGLASLTVTIYMGLGILLGASLGYLGLGAQPPTAEWGVMVADGKNFMATAWWISTFPGLALTLAGVTFSLIGDGLADALRPRA